MRCTVARDGNCSGGSGAAHQLMHDPLRTPPRMRPAQLTHPRLQLCRRPVRARPRPARPIRQPRQARRAIAPDPRMHRLARHADLARDLAHRGAVQHRHHRPVPLLDDRQRHQSQSRPPAQSAQADHGQRRQAGPEHSDVKHVPRQDRRRPTGAVRTFSTNQGRLASLAAAPAAGGRKRPSSPAPGTTQGSAHGGLAVRYAIHSATTPPRRRSFPHISGPVDSPTAYARGITAMQQRLAPLLDRLADTFDRSAELSEQHARRLSDHGDAAGQAVEYERAKRARDAARRARTHAHRLRERTSANETPPRRGSRSPLRTG